MKTQRCRIHRRSASGKGHFWGFRSQVRGSVCRPRRHPAASTRGPAFPESQRPARRVQALIKNNGAVHKWKEIAVSASIDARHCGGPPRQNGPTQRLRVEAERERESEKGRRQQLLIGRFLVEKCRQFQRKAPKWKLWRSYLLRLCRAWKRGEEGGNGRERKEWGVESNELWRAIEKSMRWLKLRIMLGRTWCHN